MGGLQQRAVWRRAGHAPASIVNILRAMDVSKTDCRDLTTGKLTERYSSLYVHGNHFSIGSNARPPAMDTSRT